MKSIGFIGLGNMGNPMVKNLLKAGFQVVVYDVSQSAIDALVTAGAIPANTISDVVCGADVIITMLQNGKQVKEVCLSAEGIFATAKKHALYIDTSSIEISISRELHKLAEQKKIAMLDAPVSGGVAGAQAATLAIMVGGSEEHFKMAKPLLKKLGKKVIHAGGPGHGQAAKICNNLILGISMIAVSEGFSLGKKLGLDPQKFFEISSNASGQCWSMTSYCPVPNIIESSPANKDYQPGFMAKMMLKDLRLGQEAALSVNANIPLGAEAAELFSLFVNQGCGEKDFSGIINMIAGDGVFDKK